MQCGKTGMGTAQNQMGVQGKDGLDGRPTGRAKEARAEVEVEDEGGVSWRNWNRQAAGWACPVGTGCPAARHSPLGLGLDSPPSQLLKFWPRSPVIAAAFQTKPSKTAFSAATSPSRTCEPVTLPFHSSIYHRRPWKPGLVGSFVSFVAQAPFTSRGVFTTPQHNNLVYCRPCSPAFVSLDGVNSLFKRIPFTAARWCCSCWAKLYYNGANWRPISLLPAVVISLLVFLDRDPIIIIYPFTSPFTIRYICTTPDCVHIFRGELGG